jgi:uncharacterized protein YbcI
MTTNAQQVSEGRERQAVDLAEISNAMVRLYKEMFGRGPTKARSDLAGDDILVCTLEDSLTPAERNMAKAGEHQRLRDLRLYFQYASEKEFIGVIEEITGRQVRAFISGMDTHRDVATEVYYLESANAPGRASERNDELSPG